MTNIEQALAQGFGALLEVGARQFTPSTGGSVQMLVDDAPDVGEPTNMPQAKSPIYARLSCKAGSIESPYAVTTFTEAGTNKIYTVLKYEEDLTAVSQQWLCEKQR